MKRELWILGAIGASLLATGRASAGPQLYPDKWVQITPPMVKTGAPETCIGQGIAVDPQKPSTIYWGNTPYTEAAGGLFKSEDGGSNWTRIAAVKPAWQGANDWLSMPVHVRVDPNDSNHLYAGSGVRGSAQGFFVSNDGGATFAIPPGWQAALDANSIGTTDVYDIAVDPDNFLHALVSFHSAWGWDDTKWQRDAGILETTDGGNHWIRHDPVKGWLAGHSIKFLRDVKQNIGSSKIWLLGTQSGGYWRTEDSGGTWTKVSDVEISHGGSTHYYGKGGWLYTSGLSTLRSNDNGLTWSTILPTATWAIFGDGDRLYTGQSFGGNQPFQVASEDDGAAWGKMPGDQIFSDGPYEMAYDQYYGILYSSNWTSGVWALKANAGTGKIPPLTMPKPIPVGSAGASADGTSGGAGGTATNGSGGAASSVGGGVSASGGAADEMPAPVEADSGGCAYGSLGTGGSGRAPTLLAGLILGVSLLRRRRADRRRDS